MVSNIGNRYFNMNHIWVPDKENSEFKPVKLDLTDLVSYPARVEGLKNRIISTKE